MAIVTRIGVIADATSANKGAIQLSGNLGGTALLPTVTGITISGVSIPIAGIAVGEYVCRTAQGITSTPPPTSVPAGVVMDYAGSSIPSGWLECDGSAVSRTTYSTLFSAIGTTWGAGNGSTTFNVPDLRRRTTVGAGGTGTATLASGVGSTGGAETHTLSTTEMPSHNHGGSTGNTSVAGGLVEGVSLYPMLSYYDTTTSFSSHSHTISSQGGGGSHNNIQPSAVVKKIIKT